MLRAAQHLGEQETPAVLCYRGSLGVGLLAALAIALAKLAALVLVVFVAGSRLITWVLVHVAREHGLLPPTGASLLVACAVVSIAVNPLLFPLLDALEGGLRRRPALWRLLDAAAARRRDAVNRSVAVASEAASAPLAVVVGYGLGMDVATIARETDRVRRDTLGEPAASEPPPLAT